MIGIVCFEQGGPPHSWTIDEQLFASAIADSIAILLEAIERIKAEKALQEKEQLLSSIYDTVGDMIFVLSTEKEGRYKFVSVNKSFENKQGKKYSEVVGKYVDEIIPQSALSKAQENYKKAILDKKIVRWEEVSDYPGGQLTWEVSIAPLFDEKGDSILLVGAVHDITDRKNTEDNIRKMNQQLEERVKERTTSMTQAQESLKRSEEKYRKIVEEVGDVVFSSDYKGYFTYINPMCKKITGYLENELIGKHFSEIIDPEWKDRVAKFYKEQFDNKIRETMFSFPIIIKSGEKKWVEQTVIQQRDGDKITGHQAIVRDITDRKKIEEEIKQKSEELFRSNQELEQFAYVASHDLQEPLRTIANFVGLLEKTQCAKKDDEANNYLNFIISATSKMQNLIKDLLDYSRVGKSITFSIVDCNTILKDVLAGMGASIQGSNAKITYDILPKVKGNDIQLKQVFQNLISNSIKFRKKNSIPEIKISVEEKATEYIFAVKDNGIGIDEKHINKLFVLFQRLHPEAEYPGTGIGLATSKKIVLLHGGKIWVESKLGEGSNFYFTLPKEKSN
jgi:PAS domain S-box-containing protein